MKGQFDDTATIVSPGATLQVTGPVEEWEDDEFGAVIYARVKLGDIVASGASGFIQKPADAWSATLTAHSGTFQGGAAEAIAHAMVSTVDGHTEPYNWRDQVDLPVERVH